jgi:hypothetical protein
MKLILDGNDWGGRLLPFVGLVTALHTACVVCSAVWYDGWNERADFLFFFHFLILLGGFYQFRDRN